MNFTRLSCDLLKTFWILTLHITLLSTFVTYNVLARLALNWINNNILAFWAHKIFIYFILRKDCGELRGLGCQTTHLTRSNIRQTKSQNRLGFLNTVVHFFVVSLEYILKMSSVLVFQNFELLLLGIALIMIWRSHSFWNLNSTFTVKSIDLLWIFNFNILLIRLVAATFELLIRSRSRIYIIIKTISSFLMPSI
jgi:hypothetical protein